MARLEDLKKGDRVFAKPAQLRGTVERIKSRPIRYTRPVEVRLNGTGTIRAFAPEELVKLTEETGK